jgi:uncharacterized membrane protein
LPEQFATHFDLNGNPNDWSHKGSFVYFFGGVFLFSNAIMAGLYRWIHRLPDDAINLPHKSFWFADPEKRAMGYERLRIVLSMAGAFTSLVFIFCLHIIFQQAQVVSFFLVSVNVGLVGIALLTVGLIVSSIMITRPPN